ncbi:hypothetical protein Ait01nite_024490 [Actinoplanes italicus]|uniref:Putative membrane protein n=1 Tax=Actinoplanes italicus TaxID=113567 RepID=A0A2T0KFM1_9ACTN|nr:alpha/beta-hydrolase family protein [Actinoplanes italicus]PRX22176.1 putative membrane protein [Actinoplanes italicus]GIE29404.1 hypothetical protein Ait01nite_024490 [Actinoplanes italicus]
MRPIRLLRPGPRPDLIASASAAVLLCLSFTPSLLPRGWFLQGLVSGLCAATGYALGSLPRIVVRWRAGRSAWLLFAAVAVPATLLAAVLGRRWQNGIGHQMGVDGPAALTWPGALAVAATVFAVLLAAARAVVPLATLVLLAVLAAPWSLGALSTALDDRVTGVAAPAGTTHSLVPWSSLGRQGRAFVTGGRNTPHTETPIRVYAGLQSAPTTRDRARLAVAELQRTGAFSREVLCIVVPTGSGWVDEPTVAALEDEFDGDTALVAVQYAALPSWLSLAMEPERAEAAAADLLDEVSRVWSVLPATDRPKLLLYGHSLGARAAQAPFGTAANLLDAVDGALISGTPGGSPLRSRVSSGRVIILEHATDPVVHWSPRLFLTGPVGFWQISGDLLKAQDVPAGYGHRYGAEARTAWQLIRAHLIHGGSA